MATLMDMLSGAFPARLTLRLSTSPIVHPATLLNIVEATFRGYTPADFTATGRAPPSNGWGYCAGYGVFSFLGPAAFIQLTAVYLTSYDRQREELLYLIPLANTPYAIFRTGPRIISVEFSANIYVPPG